MTRPEPGDVWRRSAQVAFVDDGERVVLLSLSDPRKGRPGLLAGPAAAVWRTLERSQRVTDVVEELAGHFGLSTDQISIDVEAFLHALEGKGLIYRSPSVRP